MAKKKAGKQTAQFPRMSPEQQEIFLHIAREKENHPLNLSPTITQIAKSFGKAPPTIWQHVEALHSKKLIEKMNSSYAVTLTPLGNDAYDRLTKQPVK